MPSEPTAAGSPRFALTLAALALIHVATRTWGLTLVPAFMDESMHLCWAARFARDPEFVKPLQDGKLLHVLLTALVVPRAADPLWAARFVSVLTGTVGLVVAGLLGRRLYGAGVGVAAAVLYLVCPFTLFYDRMDLADVYLSTCAGAALLMAVVVADAPSPARAVGLGVALAAAIVAKIPGLLLLPLPLFAVLLRGRKPGAMRSLAIAYAVCVAIAAGPAAYFFARSTQVEAKAALVGDRLALLLENAGLVSHWLWSYWTPPLLVVGLVVGVVGAARRRSAEILLLAACLLPIVAFALIAYDWFPRYVLLATIPLLILAARGFTAAAESSWHRTGRSVLATALVACVGVAALLPALRFDAALLTAPAAAPLVPVEIFQYVNGWPSGYGWDEAMLALRAERARYPDGLAIVADTAGRGAGRWAARATFVNDRGVQVEVIDFSDPAAVEVVESLAASRPTFALRSTAVALTGTPRFRADAVAVLRKPNKAYAGTLYRFVPR